MTNGVPGRKAEVADYGNWVSTRLLVVPGALSLLLLIGTFFAPFLGVGALVFFVCFLYFAYARRLLSPRGGDIQSKLRALVVDRLGAWDGAGKVLDIGCGNGPLAIEIAKRHPRSEVTGIDSWGAGWGYSGSVCERNATAEGVSGRTKFVRASAEALPFGDGSFDAVVSNLVFHEVRSVKDKRELLKEALRVLKKGGVFAFQDVFLWTAVYGDIDSLLAGVRSWGIDEVDFTATNDAPFVSPSLKLPFMLGTVGMIYGRK